MTDDEIEFEKEREDRINALFADITEGINRTEHRNFYRGLTVGWGSAVIVAAATCMISYL